MKDRDSRAEDPITEIDGMEIFIPKVKGEGPVEHLNTLIGGIMEDTSPSTLGLGLARDRNKNYEPPQGSTAAGKGHPGRRRTSQ